MTNETHGGTGFALDLPEVKGGGTPQNLRGSATLMDMPAGQVFNTDTGQPEVGPMIASGERAGDDVDSAKAKKLGNFARFAAGFGYKAHNFMNRHNKAIRRTIAGLAGVALFGAGHMTTVLWQKSGADVGAKCTGSELILYDYNPSSATLGCKDGSTPVVGMVNTGNGNVKIGAPISQLFRPKNLQFEPNKDAHTITIEPAPSGSWDFSSADTGNS